MDAIGINIPGLVAQIINFTLLLIILYLVLYKPILRMLDQRRDRIRESMERAEEIKQEMAKAQQEVAAQLDAARKEGQNIIAQASQIGERLKEEARGQARQEAEAIISRAQSAIQAERDQAIADLRNEFADLAVLAASRVINKSLDKSAHARLIEEVLEETGKLKA